MVRVIDVLAEGETWLTRTGGVGGLHWSDIVLSGPTEIGGREEQNQYVGNVKNLIHQLHLGWIDILLQLCKYSFYAHENSPPWIPLAYELP